MRGEFFTCANQSPFKKNCLSLYIPPLDLDLSAKSYNLLATVEAGLGKYKNAIKNYSKAIKLDNTNYIYYHNRALAYEGIKAYKSALRDYSQVLRIKKDYIPSLLNRAELHITFNRNYGPAILDLNRVIQYRPGYDTYLIRRGKVYETGGRYQKATEDYTKAIELNGNEQAEAYFLRGKVNFYFLKNVSKARADYKHALNIKRDHVRAKAELKKIGFY